MTESTPVSGREPELQHLRSRSGNEPELSNQRPKCPICAQMMFKRGDGWQCNRMACMRQQHGSFARMHVALREKLESDPEWFQVGKTTPAAHINNVRAGRHPMGHPLLNQPNATCGNCVLLRTTHADKTYFKCGLFPDIHSPNYDIRKKWAACNQWADRGE